MVTASSKHDMYLLPLSDVHGFTAVVHWLSAVYRRNVSGDALVTVAVLLRSHHTPQDQPISIEDCDTANLLGLWRREQQSRGTQ